MGAYYAHFKFVLDSRVALHALQSKEILFRPWHHIKNVKNKIKKKIVWSQSFRDYIYIGLPHYLKLQPCCSRPWRLKPCDTRLTGEPADGISSVSSLQ